ncbi:hypothetical protein Gobs01_02070 [Geodermatophilus obscurus DSM 43160]
MRLDCRAAGVLAARPRRRSRVPPREARRGPRGEQIGEQLAPHVQIHGVSGLLRRQSVAGHVPEVDREIAAQGVGEGSPQGRRPRRAMAEDDRRPEPALSHATERPRHEYRRSSELIPAAALSLSRRPRSDPPPATPSRPGPCPGLRRAGSGHQDGSGPVQHRANGRSSQPTHQAAADAQPDEDVAGLAGDVLVAVRPACSGRFPTCVTAARWSTRLPRRPLSGWRPLDSGRSARHRRNGARTSPRGSGRRRPAARRRCPDRGAAARSGWPAAPVSCRGAPPTPRQGRGGGGGADAPPPH